MSGFIAPDHAYSLGCLPVAIRSKLLAWKTCPLHRGGTAFWAGLLATLAGL